MAWTRLDARKGWLTKARLAAGKDEPHASSAAEWLWDNDYQIQRSILQIREDLAQEFSAKLPVPGEGGLARPRIHHKLGTASSWDRVYLYVKISMISVSFKKKHK